MALSSPVPPSKSTDGRRPNADDNEEPSTSNGNVVVEATTTTTVTPTTVVHIDDEEFDDDDDDDDDDDSHDSHDSDDEPSPVPMTKDKYPADKSKSLERCIFRILYIMLTLSIAGLAVAIVMYVRAINATNRATKNQDTIEETEEGIFDRDIESYRTQLQNMLSPLVKFSDLLEDTSPQAEALEWLVFEDRVLDIVDLEKQQQMMMEGNTPYPLYQRYALMTLFFATGGELWDDMDDAAWTDKGNVHECDFVGVECNDKKQVIGLDLYLRKLRGRTYYPKKNVEGKVMK